MGFTLSEPAAWPPVPLVRRYAWFLIVVALLSASPATAQPADSISALVVRIEQALGSGDPGTLPPLFAPGIETSQVDALIESAGCAVAGDALSTATTLRNHA